MGNPLKTNQIHYHMINIIGVTEDPNTCHNIFDINRGNKQQGEFEGGHKIHTF